MDNGRRTRDRSELLHDPGGNRDILLRLVRFAPTKGARNKERRVSRPPVKVSMAAGKPPLFFFMAELQFFKVFSFSRL
jgi:hypothetical protein